MTASQLLKILEQGIPVIGRKYIYRLIDNRLQIGVSCNKEPVYMGSHIENLFELAAELTEADQVNLAFIALQVTESKSDSPKTFEHEKKYFEQLGCQVPADLSF